MAVNADYARMAWRTGRSIGRTIYAVPPGAQYRSGDEVVLGMMDTPALASHIVKIHNMWLYEERLADQSDGDGGG